MRKEIKLSVHLKKEQTKIRLNLTISELIQLLDIIINKIKE